jgi:formylmethanofuran dehydrogenase subunit A
MINSTKGYAIKIVNPGGLEAWGFGSNLFNIDDSVPNFGISPREIIYGLCKINKILALPHTIHVHTNNLGKPGNYLTTLKTMKCVENLAFGNTPIIHITHCQFSAFKGDDWATLESGADKIADYVNSHSHVTLDMGQIIFTNTTTLTADGPFQHNLHRLSGNKWMNHDVETETSSGVVPFSYKKKNYVNATQWAIGLELALLIKNPWKIFMTTDHPNGGPFIYYPKIIAWLMSKKARNATLQEINRRAKSRSILPSIERELTLIEIATVTRAGQAKALGMPQKGHLGVGADADVAIYNINPRNIDLSNEYKLVQRAFTSTAFTIKTGKIVSKKGVLRDHEKGSTIWSDVHLSDPLLIDKAFRNQFKSYWTVEYENYLVSKEYLHLSNPIKVEAQI